MSTDPRPVESAPAPASKRGRNKRSIKSTPAPEPMLIDAESAAVVLGISPRTLWSLTNRNAVPCVRIGARVLYRPDHLSAWLDAGAPDEPGAADKILRDVRRMGGGR